MTLQVNGILGVWTREFARIERYLFPLLGDTAAGHVAAETMADLWYLATAATPLEQCVYVWMMRQAKARAMAYVQAELLASAERALSKPEVPPERLALKLSEAYVSLAFAADVAGIGIDERSLVARQLRRRRPDPQLQAHYPPPASWTTDVGAALRPLAAALLYPATAPFDARLRADQLWASQEGMVKAWLFVPAARKVPDAEQEHQDHDPRDSGSPE